MFCEDKCNKTGPPCKHCPGTDHHSLLHVKGKKEKKGLAKVQLSVSQETGTDDQGKTDSDSSPLEEEEVAQPSPKRNHVTKAVARATAGARDAVSLSTGVVKVKHAKTGAIWTLNALDDSCASDVAMSLTMALKLGLEGKMEKHA